MVVHARKKSEKVFYLFMGLQIMVYLGVITFLTIMFPLRNSSHLATMVMLAFLVTLGVTVYSQDKVG